VAVVRGAVGSSLTVIDRGLSTLPTKSVERRRIAKRLRRPLLSAIIGFDRDWTVPVWNMIVRSSARR